MKHRLLMLTLALGAVTACHDATAPDRASPFDLLLARDLRFLPVELHGKLTGQVEEVRRMLSGLIQQLK